MILRYFLAIIAATSISGSMMEDDFVEFQELSRDSRDKDDHASSSKRSRNMPAEISTGARLISYEPFTRRWNFVTPKVRQLALEILRKEIGRRIGSSRPKTMHEIRRAVQTQIKNDSRDVQDYTVKVGKLVFQDPRLMVQKHENDVEDFLQYVFFKRQILQPIHEELMRIALDREMVLANEIIERLNHAHPDLLIVERYAVEDIVDWYNIVASNHGEVVDLQNGWVQMTDETFAQLISALETAENFDNRMNGKFSAFQEISLGMTMTPLALMREWKQLHVFGRGESVVISDGLGSYIPPRAEIHMEGPYYPLELVQEWTKSSAAPKSPKISNQVSDNLRNILFPMRFPSLAIPEDEHEQFLRPLLAAGTMRFPFDNSIYAHVAHGRRRGKFERILNSISEYALIDAEVYARIRSIYIGAGETAKVSRGVSLQDIAEKCSSASEIAKICKSIDPIKYAYLTAEHVAAWAQFVLHSEPEEYDEIQELRKFTIRVNGGLRTLLFMESQFVKFVEFVINP